MLRQLIKSYLTSSRYFVAMPNLFFDDPIPLNRGEGFDIMKWFGGEYNKAKQPHTPEFVDPIVKKSIEALRSKYGVKVRKKSINTVRS